MGSSESTCGPRFISKCSTILLSTHSLLSWQWFLFRMVKTAMPPAVFENTRLLELLWRHVKLKWGVVPSIFFTTHVFGELIPAAAGDTNKSSFRRYQTCCVQAENLKLVTPGPGVELNSSRQGSNFFVCVSGTNHLMKVLNLVSKMH